MRTPCRITIRSSGGSTLSTTSSSTCPTCSPPGQLTHRGAQLGAGGGGTVPTSTLAVIVLVVYFLAGMPRIKRFARPAGPGSRRARVILLGDEIFTKVGGFVLGNVVTSVIAGLGTYLWMLVVRHSRPDPAGVVRRHAWT